ncbi:MAG: cysteine peptidase family C39 domain-containing protein [Pseudomonadota bacterium]|nr:cysteine peptidase family C39 domain-containing protein [Pseudomonadota bacterium]
MAFDTGSDAGCSATDMRHPAAARVTRMVRRMAPVGLLVLVACAQPATPALLRPLSLLALRYEATVPQRFDYTCGAASVATVLTYYWDRPTTEADVIRVLRQRYSLDEIARRRETGLSFDDLIFVAGGLGFQAQGAKISPDQLPDLQGPVIVQLTSPKFQHFAVLRQVGQQVYYVSDPIVGQLSMGAAEFRAEFTGYALAIWRTGTKLPADSKLRLPRDGLSVTNSLDKVINAPPWAPHPIL